MVIKKIANSFKDMPSSVKAAIAFAFSSFILRSVAFITTPIFTRIMSVEQYGIVSVYNSWYTIIEVFSLLGLNSAGVFNVGLNDYSNSRDKYIYNVLLICNFTTILVFSFIFVLEYYFKGLFNLPLNLLVLMFVQFLLCPSQTFWITHERYEYRYKLSTLVTVLGGILAQFISVICIIKMDTSTQASVKLWSSGLINVCMCIPIYIYIFYKGKLSLDFSIWKQTLVFAIPLIPHYLAQHVMSSADRIMISQMHSEAQAGIYSVASAIGMITSFIWSAINSSITPFIHKNLNERKFSDINKTIELIIVLYSLLCFFVALVAPEILAILAPKTYSRAAYALPPIATVSFLMALYNIYSIIEFYYKRASNIASATVVACLTNVILNYLFIPRFGFVAAAYTTLIANLILVFMHYWGYRKSTKQKIYRDKILMIISLITIFLCLLCNFVYYLPILRYGILLTVCVILLINRKRIIKKLKM